MKLHFLVEGPSEERLLSALLPRLVPKHTFWIYPHQGKGKLPAKAAASPDQKRRGLLDQLPAKLRAFGKSLSPTTDRVVVLVDLDNDNCQLLLSNLEQLMKQIRPAPTCLFRLAIEETEAWYLGDWSAIKRAFPRSRQTPEYRRYEADSICGSWELFQQLIEDPLERKPYWAEQIGPQLLAIDAGSANRSPSFHKFCQGVRRLAGESDPKTGPRTKK